MSDLATSMPHRNSFDEDKPVHSIRGGVRSTLLIIMLACVGLVVTGISLATNSVGVEGWTFTAVLAGALLVVVTIFHIYLFHYRPTLQQYSADNQIVSINYEALR